MTLFSLHKQFLKYTCFQNVQTSFTWFCLAGALLFAQPSLAQHLEKHETEGQIHYEEQTLTGDWNGFRSRLHDRGIHWEIEYFGDTLTHFREGQDTKLRYFGVLASELHINTDRLVQWKGGEFYIFGTWQDGKGFQNTLGSVHDASSIEAPNNINLMQLWFEQKWWEDRIALLFGLYDIANDFDYRDTAQLFVNGAFGTGVDLTASSDLGVPTYPLTALAVRLRAKLFDNLYYLGVVADGVPGDPIRSHGTQVVLDQDDGLLIMNEIGYDSDRPRRGLNKAGLGFWVFTKNFDDLTAVNASGSPLQRNGTEGVYAFVEGTLYEEALRSPQGLASFFRIGYTDEDVNPLSWYWDSGLVYTGLIPGRDADALGAAISVIYFNDKFKQASRGSGLVIDDPEYLMEITYKYLGGPGWYLQPNIQYLANPVGRTGARDALSIGFRLGLYL